MEIRERCFIPTKKDQPTFLPPKLCLKELSREDNPLQERYAETFSFPRKKRIK